MAEWIRRLTTDQEIPGSSPGRVNSLDMFLRKFLQPEEKSGTTEFRSLNLSLESERSTDWALAPFMLRYHYAQWCSMMRDAAGHDILWSAFTLFFLLYGQLFCAIEQSRICLNGGSYRWSGFGCEKWTNVREFQDYSSLASLVFRNESLADHLHGHLHADCDLLYWLPWNSNNGFLGRFIVLLGSPNTGRGSLKIKFRRQKRPCAYYANSNATFHLILDVGDLVFQLNPGPNNRTTTIVSSNRMVKNGHLWSGHSLPKGANLHNLRSLDHISVAPNFS